ncbi:MAG: hypothetical protein KF819_01010 [Labilithrix sp.]|nr:hypothetical protein [Labilithrix sp.]
MPVTLSPRPAADGGEAAVEELDLPPLDGEGEGEESEAHADDELSDPAADAAEDPLDDATGEADPLEEIVTVGAEGGWLDDADDARAVDVGPFDLSFGVEGSALDHEEAEPLMPDEDLAGGEDALYADAGEEGPLADDEELREEDLPALDADEDGDVEEEGLYDRALLDHDEELRWDDRAWARVQLPAPAEGEDADDSGMLAVPGEDPKHGARDALWRKLEETGRITAAVLVPGESVIVALDAPERPVLVRIPTSGLARIIAEIEIGAADDEGVVCRITTLKWDAARGCLVALGTFGVQAFRPA